MTRAIATATLLALAGCGESGVRPEDRRYPVTLTLTLDGTPLRSGAVELLPFDGRGPASAPVAGGRAELSAVAGRLRVEVRSFRTPPGSPEPVNVLPARYNEDSTLTVEVTPGGPNEFPLDLRSR